MSFQQHIAGYKKTHLPSGNVANDIKATCPICCEELQNAFATMSTPHGHRIHVLCLEKCIIHSRNSDCLICKAYISNVPLMYSAGDDESELDYESFIDLFIKSHNLEEKDKVITELSDLVTGMHIQEICNTPKKV